MKLMPEFMTMFTELVQNLGFPIACCVALFWRNSKLEQSHKEDLKALESSIQANTTIMNAILSEVQHLKES